MGWATKFALSAGGLLAGGLLLICSVAALPASGVAESSHEDPVMRNPLSTPRGTSGTADVPAAAPYAIAIPGIGVEATVQPYTLAQAKTGYDGFTGTGCYDAASNTITCVSPPDDRIVSWQTPIPGVNGIGVGAAPGTDATGTVYLYGHSIDATGDAVGVFQNLSRLQAGNEVVLSTVNGRLTYAVQQVVHLPKQDYYCPDSTHPANTYTAMLCDQVSGRLLLVSCDHDPGAETVNGGYAVSNTVVKLQLEVSRDAQK
jgi:hypothetical protein